MTKFLHKDPFLSVQSIVDVVLAQQKFVSELPNCLNGQNASIKKSQSLQWI